MTFFAPMQQSGNADIEVIADFDLSSLRAVMWQGPGVMYADATNPDPTLQVIGITVTAARAGSKLIVRTAGIIQDPSFSFIPGTTIYLGANGLLTTIQPMAPDYAVDVAVGMAFSSDSLLIRVGQLISLL